MKRLFLFSAVLCVVSVPAAGQLPLPGYLLSDVVERQVGVAHYTNELFDFSSLPAASPIDRFLVLRDTVRFKEYIYDVAVCDAAGCVGRVRFQDDVQIVRRDTITRVFVTNPQMHVTLCGCLPPDATDAQVAWTVDSLRQVRAFADEPDIQPTNQNGLSYALQYLFARHGIDSQPVFGDKTYVLRTDESAMLDYCCDCVKRLRVGADIERFARKAIFDEEFLYVGEGPQGRRAWFFYHDGRFWMKFGPCQYLTFNDVISVWRHDKSMTHIAAYRLKSCFY